MQVINTPIVFRFFIFDEENRSLVSILSTDFHNHCVLKVCHLVYKQRIIFLSAATDGQIALWDITTVLQKYFTSRESDFSDLRKDESSKSLEVPTDCLSQRTCSNESSSELVMNPLESSFEDLSVETSQYEHSNVSLKNSSDVLEDNCNARTSLDQSSSESVINSSEVQKDSSFVRASVDDSNSDTVNMKPLFCLRCHQSGINSLNVLRISGILRFVWNCLLLIN